MLPGNEHFLISSLIAAISGTAGSPLDRFPCASTWSTSTFGATVRIPALNGLTSGDGALLVHAPRGGSLPGAFTCLGGSDVFGRGRTDGWTSSDNLLNNNWRSLTKLYRYQVFYGVKLVMLNKYKTGLALLLCPFLVKLQLSSLCVLVIKIIDSCIYRVCKHQRTLFIIVSHSINNSLIFVNHY